MNESTGWNQLNCRDGQCRWISAPKQNCPRTTNAIIEANTGRKGYSNSTAQICWRDFMRFERSISWDL
eukprot:scaffold25501_cov117-Cylindrotheca_fusiformis.AAC.2